MEKSRNYIGIDISKLSFDVAIEDSGKYKHYKFSNDEAGFVAFSKHLEQASSVCVMEASGCYYLQLATYLSSHHFSVCVINPLVIKRFCQMRMSRTKTDKKDACMIAQYGKTEQPSLWDAEEAYVLELKQMQSYLQQLNKSRGNFLRQQEAFKHNPVISARTHTGLEEMIKTLEKEMQQIEASMEAIVRTHHQQMFEQLISIPGIGKKTALLLIVVSKGFKKFSNAKQLASYIGISPRIFESGTSVKGKSKICKMGMSKIRAALYLCSWSAIKRNKACENLYERLVAAGKSKKLALIAVVNKLLKQAFAIATKKQYYQPNLI